MQAFEIIGGILLIVLILAGSGGAAFYYFRREKAAALRRWAALSPRATARTEQKRWMCSFPNIRK